jgi:hypothetical protein
MVALALAAVMPASVHIDTMVTQEALSNLLSVAFVVVLLEVCRRPIDQRRNLALCLGALTGLGLVTKISALVLLCVLFAAPVMECIQRRITAVADAVAIVKPWAMAAGVALALSGWQFVYNQVHYGKAVLDGWHMRPTADTIAAGAHRTPVLDRRTLGYYVAYPTDVLEYPFFPVGNEPRPRFWPVLVASSFVDHNSYHFAPSFDRGRSQLARGSLVGQRSVELARHSALGGTLISLATLLTGLLVLPRMLINREVGRLLALAVPALAVLGQLVFATQFPYDFEGVVKGVYFQFATLPLYALFGVGVGWLWQRPVFRPGALLLGFSVLGPAAYTLHCVTS